MTFALILRRAIDWFYRRPFSRVISETVFRYGACGAITLSVDAVSYALIYHFLVAGRYFDLGFVVIYKCNSLLRIAHHKRTLQQICHVILSIAMSPSARCLLRRANSWGAIY